MKNKLIAAIVMMAFSAGVYGQKYFTKTGKVSFFSETPVENIEAVTNSASTVIDLESGKIQWAVLIKSFEFEKALMQEHFNENYMESTKYPKAKFKGQVLNHESLNFQKDGVYDVDVKGILEIHGVKNEITTSATFEVENGEIKARSNFKVSVADYGIEIPSVVRENIAKEIEIKITGKYESLSS